MTAPRLGRPRNPLIPRDHFHLVLASRMTRLGIGPAEVARRVGRSPRTVEAWILGRGKPAGFERVLKLLEMP